MSTSQGKRFEREFNSSVTNADGAYGVLCRITDKVFNDGFGHMKSEESVADFWWFIPRVSLHCILVECKATSTKRITFASLAEHQKVSLRDHESLHEAAHGVVAVNVYDPLDKRHVNRLFIIPIDVWCEYESGEKKSIALKSLEEDDRIFECPRVKGSIWDLSKYVAIYNQGRNNGTEE